MRTRSGGFGKVSRVGRILLALLSLVLGASRADAARISPELSPGAQRVTIAGAEIAYHVAGKGPVVRVHQVEKFATVVIIEPIGTGGSDRLQDPSGFTIDRYVGDVEGLRAHLGL